MNEECQVKQFVAQITDKHDRTFNVYQTADPKYYLFRPTQNGCEGTIDMPIKKTDLKREVSHALRNGISLRMSQN